MRGRDTGTPEHRRAAEYVAHELAKNGVIPAGDNGTWFQAVPLRSYRLNARASSAVLTRRGGGTRQLRWLQHITVTPALGMPATLSGRLVFAGSDNAAGLDTGGAIVVRLNPVRLVAGPAAPPPPPGAVATIGIESTTGPEPTRWPSQYAVSMTLADTPTPALNGVPAFRFNPAAADQLLDGTGRSYRELVELSAAGRPVPSFVIDGTLALTLRFDSATLSSDNVIGVLPGSDATLQAQHVVVSAHLDGYGIGEAWGSDTIYNGAFDNAAYVATLIDFAEKVRASGTRPRRSLLFAVVTGEEKGLLGSRYYDPAPDGAAGTPGSQRQPRPTTSNLPAAYADDARDRRVDVGRHGAAGGERHGYPPAGGSRAAT